MDSKRSAINMSLPKNEDALMIVTMVINMVTVLVALVMGSAKPWNIIGVISVLIINVAAMVLHAKGLIETTQGVLFLSFGANAILCSSLPSSVILIVIPIIHFATGYNEGYSDKTELKLKVALAFFFVITYSMKYLRNPVLAKNLFWCDVIMLLDAFLCVFVIAKNINLRSENLAGLAEKAESDSVHDQLTGLYNRKTLDAFVEDQVSRIEPFSLIMMDIDNFKKVNDTYGHTEGDHILKDLAKAISSCLRDGDRAFRYGGEEFCIVCPKTSANGAAKLAERVRIAFNTPEYVYESMEDPDLRVRHFTVSLGVAETKYGKFKSVKEFIERADEALYEAKHTGKNKVVVSGVTPVMIQQQR